MSLRVIVPPVAAVVSLPETKTHLRVTESHEDAAIAGYIFASQSYAETIIGRALTRRTYELTVDRWPVAGEVIELPYPPVPAEAIGSPPASAVTVSYVAPNGDLQILDPAIYQLVGLGDDSRRARVVLAYGQTWPAIRSQPEAVLIEYVAGYANPAVVPEPIRMAVLLRIGTHYAQREALLESGVFESTVADRLLAPYRVW